MQDLTVETTYALATRINQIDYEIRQLEIEHNRIVSELSRRYPHLKNDENLRPKVLKKCKDEVF